MTGKPLEDHWKHGSTLETHWLPTILSPVAFQCTLGSKFQAHWIATGLLLEDHCLRVRGLTSLWQHLRHTLPVVFIINGFEWALISYATQRELRLPFIVARLREPRDSNVGILENKPTLLTISRLWHYCGPSNYRFNFLLYWYAPWVFFEVANVLSCSPFMFENTENKQLHWRVRHSHLVSTLFHSLVRWWCPRRIRPQIIRLSQLENSAMGTWPIYKNFIIPDWFEKWRDIKFWYRC